MAFYVPRRIIRRLPGDVIHAVPIPEPEVTQGFGTRERIGDICRDMGAKSVLLVTDRTLYGLGLHDKAVASLKEAGIACSVFSDIDSEPTVDIISAGRLAAVDCHADCIVALGGGSVMDSSKIISAGARRPRKSIRRYLHKFDFIYGGTLPMITVPSTAGTGAENTVGAVVKNSRGVKCSTVVVGLDVRHVILDSELTVGAPRSVTVWCGIDALSHGLEGVLADVKFNKDDMDKSLECVKLVMQNLPVLLSEPGDIEARQAMALAAFYGGNAINRQLAGYIHACAHSIGGLYHIPHGKAIAYCTLPVLTQLRDLCRKKLAKLSVYCGAADAGDSPETAEDKFFTALRELLEICGLEKGCAELKEEDYPRLIRMIDADSINYSPPKTFTDKEIIQILDSIRTGE